MSDTNSELYSGVGSMTNIKFYEGVISGVQAFYLEYYYSPTAKLFNKSSKYKNFIVDINTKLVKAINNFFDSLCTECGDYKYISGDADHSQFLYEHKYAANTRIEEIHSIRYRIGNIVLVCFIIDDVNTYFLIKTGYEIDDNIYKPRVCFNSNDKYIILEDMNITTLEDIKKLDVKLNNWINSNPNPSDYCMCKLYKRGL